MLEAYLDESDSEFLGHPLLILGGYIAPLDHWLSFSEQWAAILDRYALKHFHAKDLRSQNAKLYRHLSFSKRQNLLHELAGVIASHDLTGFAVWMNPSDWKKETTRAFRCEHGSAYGICAGLLLAALNAVLAKPDQEPDRISIFLEDGHANALDAIDKIRVYKQQTDPIDMSDPTRRYWAWEDDPRRRYFLRVDGFGLVPKNKPPVQVADLFVYLLGAAARYESIPRVFEGAFDDILKSNRHLLWFWSLAEVRQLVNGFLRADEAKKQRREEVWEKINYLRSLGQEVRVLPHGIEAIGRPFTEEEFRKFKAVGKGDRET